MKYILLLVLFLLPSLVKAQGTFTAATNAETDVNAIINGPTHTAVNGDIIQIPCSGTQSVTWSSQLTSTASITLTALGASPNTGTGTFGAGTNCLTIKDNYAAAPLFNFTPTYASSNNVTTLQNINIDPITGSTTLYSPVGVAGTCTASGCPQVRMDNLGFGIGTQWNESGNSSGADWMIRVDNAVGVLDHNTLPSGSLVELANFALDAYLGVGDYGDNSWAQPNTLGGANAMYMENNVAYTNQSVNDCDIRPNGAAAGGCRFVARYNHVTAISGFFVAFLGHGLDTGGRDRGMRQAEAYNNTVTCPTSSGCDTGILSYRAGGTGMIFQNTMVVSNGGFWNHVGSTTTYRVVDSPSPWGPCVGLNSIDPWDTNDNTIYFSGTNGTAGNSLTLTDNSQNWTVNQFIPSGAPYSVYDTTQSFGAEIVSNTAHTITIQGPVHDAWTGFNNGDSYEVTRATVCADQGGRGQGNYISGSSPTPSSALSQALNPMYEWDDTATNLNAGNFGSYSLRQIANRDWYTDGSNGSPTAQTSPTSPFNGTSGVGFGTLANRPTTCTAGPGGNTSGVGYFATDTNTLYVCNPTNTWASYYTPYAYPHPLTLAQSGGSLFNGGVKISGGITLK